eukprot:494292_1
MPGSMGNDPFNPQSARGRAMIGSLRPPGAQMNQQNTALIQREGQNAVRVVRKTMRQAQKRLSIALSQIQNYITQIGKGYRKMQGKVGNDLTHLQMREQKIMRDDRHALRQNQRRMDRFAGGLQSQFERKNQYNTNHMMQTMKRNQQQFLQEQHLGHEQRQERRDFRRQQDFTRRQDISALQHQLQPQLHPLKPLPLKPLPLPLPLPLHIQKTDPMLHALLLKELQKKQRSHRYHAQPQPPPPHSKPLQPQYPPQYPPGYPPRRGQDPMEMMKLMQQQNMANFQNMKQQPMFNKNADELKRFEENEDKKLESLIKTLQERRRQRRGENGAQGKPMDMDGMVKLVHELRSKGSHGQANMLMAMMANKKRRGRGRRQRKAKNKAYEQYKEYLKKYHQYYKDWYKHFGGKPVPPPAADNSNETPPPASAPTPPSAPIGGSMMGGLGMNPMMGMGGMMNPMMMNPMMMGMGAYPTPYGQGKSGGNTYHFHVYGKGSHGGGGGTAGDESHETGGVGGTGGATAGDNTGDEAEELKELKDLGKMKEQELKAQEATAETVQKAHEEYSDELEYSTGYHWDNEYQTGLIEMSDFGDALGYNLWKAEAMDWKHFDDISDEMADEYSDYGSWDAFGSYQHYSTRIDLDWDDDSFWDTYDAQQKTKCSAILPGLFTRICLHFDADRKDAKVHFDAASVDEMNDMMMETDDDTNRMIHEMVKRQYDAKLDWNKDEDWNEIRTVYHNAQAYYDKYKRRRMQLDPDVKPFHKKHTYGVTLDLGKGHRQSLEVGIPLPVVDKCRNMFIASICLNGNLNTMKFGLKVTVATGKSLLQRAMRLSKLLSKYQGKFATVLNSFFSELKESETQNDAYHFAKNAGDEDNLYNYYYYEE